MVQLSFAAKPARSPQDIQNTPCRLDYQPFNDIVIPGGLLAFGAGVKSVEGAANYGGVPGVP